MSGQISETHQQDGRLSRIFGGRKTSAYRVEINSDMKFTGNFRASFRKRWTSKIERGTPKNGAEYSIFSRKDEVLENHLVKINKPKMGRYPTMMDTSGKMCEDNPPPQPNLSRAVTPSTRPSIVDRPSNASNGDKNMHDFMAPDGPIIGL